MLANLVFWRLMPFFTHVLLLLQPSVLCLSIATFNNDAKPPPKWILRDFDVFRIRPRQGGLPPPWNVLHGKIEPRLRGLPGLVDRATRLGGSPHLSCKRDPSKMRVYMDRRVTPPYRVISPSWDPPPPCKQALRIYLRALVCSQQYTFLPCMFCFPNSDHVMFSREFAFCLFINYAYICTCIRRNLRKNSSLGYHRVVCNGKKTSIVWEHHYGRRDVTWKRSIPLQERFFLNN